jgi:hypothetical protein
MEKEHDSFILMHFQDDAKVVAINLFRFTSSASHAGNAVDLRIKKNWPYGGPLLKSGTNILGMSALRQTS